MVPFLSVGMVSYSPSTVTMAVSLAISQISKNGLTLKYGFEVVQDHLKWRDFMLVRHCNYSPILYHFQVI